MEKHLSWHDFQKSQLVAVRATTNRDQAIFEGAIHIHCKSFALRRTQTPFHVQILSTNQK